MKKYFKENKITLIVVLFFSICLMVYAKFCFDKNREIEKSGTVIVSKLISSKKYVKTRDYFFLFFWNGKEKIISQTRLPIGFHKNIGKYYKIKYLPKYPDLMVVYPEKEVINKDEILEAGFDE